MILPDSILRFVQSSTHALIPSYPPPFFTSSFLLSLILSLMATGCFSSRFSPAPPQQDPVPGANHFVIRTLAAPDVARQEMAQLLKQRGFSFNTKTGPTIVTNWKPMPSLGSEAALKISAFIENEANATSLILRGRLRAEAFDDVPVINSDRPGAVMQNAFARLEDLAFAYPNGQVYYARD